jgi:predicted  nucleic acid-binding Zn-ribbon protein
MNPRRVALAAVLMAIALPLVLTTARAQDSITNGNGGVNGVPQQIAALRADLADARAMIKKLEASLDMEAAARMEAVGMLQNSVDMEAAVRMEADSMLQNSLDAEANARLSADLMLQNSIEAGAADGGAQITELREAIKRLPEYLLQSDKEPPAEIDETVGQ